MNSTLEPRPRSLIAEIDSLIWDAIGDNEGCPQHYGNALYDCLCSVPVPALKDALGRATDSSVTPQEGLPLDMLTLDEWKSVYAVMETEGFTEIAEKVRLARLTDRRPTDG